MEPWRTYRKTTPSRARQASEGGTIETLEGPIDYAAGDYLYIGSAGERWPEKRARFEASYDRIAGPDAEGYSTYRTRGIVSAQRQVNDAAHRGQTFTVTLPDGQVLTGKDGDYRVRDDGGAWIVDAAIFAASYTAVD